MQPPSYTETSRAPILLFLAVSPRERTDATVGVLLVAVRASLYRFTTVVTSACLLACIRFEFAVGMKFWKLFSQILYKMKKFQFARFTRGQEGGLTSRT